MSTEVAQGLREWAKGSYAAEAGVEMLIRAFGGRFAAAGWPWVMAREEVSKGSLRTDHWLDADELLNEGSTGALSSGEKLFLRFVAACSARPTLTCPTSLAWIETCRHWCSPACPTRAVRTNTPRW